MRLKCFTGNLDGMRRGLVITRSKKRAAKIAGTSLYDFNNHWTVRQDLPDLESETLYVRPYDGPGEWEPRRKEGDE